MKRFSELSNIQLELEYVKTNKSYITHINALEEMSKICEEKFGLTLSDLYDIVSYDESIRQQIMDEQQSRINDLGLSAYESTLGQAE